MNLVKLQPPLEQEPACCRMCSAVSGREWFIDLGYIEDFWGRVYYCNLCFDELALAAGYVPQSRLESAKADYRRIMDGFKEQSWELSGAVDILRAAGFDLRAFHNWLASVVAGETTVELPERKESLASGENGPPEQTDESRSDDSSVFELNF